MGNEATWARMVEVDAAWAEAWAEAARENARAWAEVEAEAVAKADEARTAKAKA